ncbi:HNH endonuclease family protein [Actinocorallia aurantiaca]|uniref:HNH endonuclease family protein n=1 Tax=Actinocorallia aurantiaca TaxID=46204 RepID=A0ABP6GZV5_9ACTN
MVLFRVCAGVLAAASAGVVGLAAPAHAEELPLRAALAELPVAAESREGYVRTAFKHWIDADKDGCSTRAEVLLAEAVDAPAQGERCVLTGGRWYSYYDDVYVDGASGLDADHVVPLAEAWDSGASAWTAQRRQDYANDLTDPRVLVAVTAKANRSKVDRDPAEWLPPRIDVRCRYASEWIAIKLRWGLSIDTTEQAALTTLTDSCPNAPITVNQFTDL